MAHYRNETNADDLYELLSSISKYIERKIKMYALGGTALTILGIKSSTLDIDIDIDNNKDYQYICEIFEQIGFKKIGSIRWQAQEGLFFDLFNGANILGTKLLSDYQEKSKFIRSFGNIELYSLLLEDIIITKLARGDQRDFSDIKHILDTKRIDIVSLAKRYKDTMETSIASNYQQKLLDLIEIKFNEWKLPLNKKIINEVKKWQ